jgi:hypothetical protein
MHITSLTQQEVARMAPGELSSTWHYYMGLDAHGAPGGGNLTAAQRATVLRNIELLEAAG